MVTNVGRRLVGCGMALAVLSACVENPATGGKMFTTMSTQQEMQLGEDTARKAIKDEGLFNPAAPASQMVENVGRRVWAQTERAAEPFQVMVLDSDTFNAWATPGYINVYRGILPYVGSEAELAALLGHESGHINARHTASQATKGTVLGVLATVGTAIIAAKTDSPEIANMASVGAGLGVAYSMGAFSRADEEQADALALRYLGKAGYDPRAALTLMDTMEAYEAYSSQVYAAFHEGKTSPESLMTALMRTHPRTPERRADLLKKAGGEPDGHVRLPAGVTPATPPSDPMGRTRYLQAVDGLPVGPKLAYGVAGRGYIAFPTQRFAFALPDGMVAQPLEPGKPRWEAVHPATGMYIRAGMEPFTTGLNPAGALKKVFPQADVIRPFELANGTTAWLARGVVDGDVKLVLGASVPTTNKIALLSAVLPPPAAAQEAELLAILARSRGLTPSEALTYRPLRLAARHVQAGDSFVSLAASLPQGALREPWFRALNGLRDAAPRLPVGSLYKTVVDGNPRL